MTQEKSADILEDNGEKVERAAFSPALGRVRWQDWRRRLISKIGLLFVALLALAAIIIIGFPIVALIWRTWQKSAWEAHSEATTDALKLSLVTTAYTMSVILLVGTALAYVLARWQFRGKRFVSVLVELPIVLPPAVAGLALLTLFGRRQGLIGPTLMEHGIRLAFSRNAVIIAQIFVALPFYVRAAQIGFQNVQRDIEEAALVDGASAFGKFWRITVPLAWRALLSGFLLSWARALGEFGATILFAGNLQGRTQTMPLLIYSVFERDINGAIWTGLILIAAATIILGITRLAEREERS